MSRIIDGKAIAAQIKDELKEEVLRLKGSGVTVGLAVILVGEDTASAIYVNNKKKACEYVGIESVSYELPADTSQEDLLALIGRLNQEEKINGILVQLPLPEHIDEEAVITAISPDKDVGGFHTESAGRLLVGRPLEDSSRRTVSVATALIHFLNGVSALGDVCNRIDAIEPGYVTAVSLSGPTALTPVWRVTTDTGAYQLDTVTGGVARAS